MKRLCIALIRFYQRHLSKLKRRPTCRFYPVCSVYAVEAFEKRGFFAGLILTVSRICRCNPFNRGAFYDPVPETGFGHTKLPRKRKNDAPAGTDGEGRVTPRKMTRFCQTGTAGADGDAQSFKQPNAESPKGTAPGADITNADYKQ